MKNVTISAVLALVLAGCASGFDAEPVAMPDGQKGFMVDCANSGLAACMNTAAETCGGPYKIVQEKTDPQVIMNNGVAITALNQMILFTCG